MRHAAVARETTSIGLRMVPFEKSAVIAYRVEADRVRIINIFYGRQDYEALDQPGEDEEN